MRDNVNFLSGLAKSIYEGLDSVSHPVFANFTLLEILFAVLFLRVCFWVIAVITGGKQDKEVHGGRLDDNNYYIYRSNVK